MPRVESNKPGVGAAVTRWFGLQVAAKVVSVALGLPLVASTVAAILAYVEELPLTFGFLAILASAALTSTLLNQSRAFLVSYNVVGKLVLTEVDLARARDDEGRVGYAISLLMKNQADIPLEFDVERISGDIDGKLAVQRPQSTGLVVDAGRPSFHAIGVVPMEPVPSGRLAGNVDFRIRYGRPGKLKYVIEGLFSFRGATDPDGNVTDVITFRDK